MILRSIVVLLCLYSSQVVAEKPVTFYGTFGIGYGDISIRSGRGFEGDDIDSATAGAAITAGLSLHNRISLDLTLSTAGGIDLFGAVDSYSTTQSYFLLGYSFFPSEKISLTPKVGYGRWDVDFNEGQLFNPGAEESFNFDEGSDLVLAGELEFRSARRFTGGLNLDYTETDFGSISNLRLFVKVKLD